MYGHATFKSHVLRRDRLCGVPFGAASFILLLVYSTPRGGIPRY